MRLNPRGLKTFFVADIPQRKTRKRPAYGKPNVKTVFVPTIETYCLPST